MATIRTLGVMTSGGDCAGLNAVIRAVTHAAVLEQGWRVLGILDGSLGLMERPLRYRELQPDAGDPLLLRGGGTFLGTVTQGDPQHYRMADGSERDRSAEFAEGARELGLDALVVIGGDGSMRIMAPLCERAGLAMVGIPKTIDNDVTGTDAAVGFASAVQLVSEALDRLQPTAASQHRIMVVEVMGRSAGHIALQGGIAGGADVIVMPELALSVDEILAHLDQRLSLRRHGALLVVAEGARFADAPPQAGLVGPWLASTLQARSGIESRCTVLGHLQRGGAPVAQDRLLASAFGVQAVRLLAEGRQGLMVGWQGQGVVEVPLATVAGSGPRLVDEAHALLAVARRLGIAIGHYRVG